MTPGNRLIALALIPVSIVLILAGTGVLHAQEIGFCPDSGKRYHCVHDGDTVWWLGTKYRLENIEAPEVGPPRCKVGGPKGFQSRDAMITILNSGNVEIDASYGDDGLGRVLARFTVNGRDAGGMLIGEGSARDYEPGAEAWCD